MAKVAISLKVDVRERTGKGGAREARDAQGKSPASFMVATSDRWRFRST